MPKFSRFIQVKAYSDKKNKVLRILEMLWAVLRNSKNAKVVLVDAFSTTAFYYTVAIAALCQLLKIPYAPILHGGNFPERLKQSRKLSRFVFYNAVINISPSGYLEHHFNKAGFQTKRIPNFLPIANYTFQLRKNISPRILWVRAFHEIYNPGLAVRVLSQLVQIFPEATLCMVGPDKDGSLELVKKLARESGVLDKIRFTGKLPKDQWISLSRDFDVFINTTNFDNMPISVLEAMALGLPVVSTSVGGLPFLIEDKKTGLLVPPNDEMAFTDAINSLLQNPDMCESLSAAARQQTEKLDWSFVREQWEAFFLSISKESKATS